MAKENTIVWQKWVDPFGSDDLEQHLLETVAQRINDPVFNEEDEEEIEEFAETIDFDTEDSDEYEENFVEQKSIRSPIRVMATPMGIIPVTENTASSKIFNFWVGHTNFSINKKIFDTIESIEGVETFDVFTRYRFRIAVGKAFSDSEVMRDINSKVYKVLNNA
jgi:hypothetical protein